MAAEYIKSNFSHAFAPEYENRNGYRLVFIYS